MSDVRVIRRSFLAGMGVAAAGLALGTFASADEQPKSAPPAKPVDPSIKEAARESGDGLRPNVFVHLAPDGTLSIVCARSEMGQGVRSTLPALIADEMGADMKRVKIVQAVGDKVYGDQNTDGSSSVRKSFADLRRIGAAARMMLVAAAAKRWNVPLNVCEAKNHQVVNLVTRGTFAFGDLANDAAKLPVPKKEDIVLRPLPPMGKELAFVDAPDIVTGRATFGADVKLPGMLTAVVRRPPVVGGRITRHDSTKTLGLKGIRFVVPLPAPSRPYGFQALGGLAVVADTTWTAMRGADLLEITWDHGENVVYDSPAYRANLERTVKSPGKVVRDVGDVDKALASAKRIVESVYYTPNLVHAPMEPPVAVARFESGHCEVWACTQNPQAARTAVAKALGIDEKRVTVHVTLLGGGFGRKSKPDFVVEAALVAKALPPGTPVRLQWTREDDVQHGYYHSTSAQRLVCGLDASGKPVAWHHRVAFPPIAALFKDASTPETGQLQQGVLDLPLAIPHVRAEACDAKAYARFGWLRSVSNIYHAFAVHSFIDEIAHARGMDARENLLEIIGPAKKWQLADLGVKEMPNYGQPLDEHPIDTARHRRVVERVTELARWKPRVPRALGLAVHRSFLATVGVVVEVVRDGGRVRADEVWVVVDAGYVVNVERARSQMEGAVIFALGHALYGEITMRSGATEQSNFRDFRLMRMYEAPRAIHVEIMPSTLPPAGIGEPGVPPVAPALANAIFALTGTRVHELPIIKSVVV